MLQERNEHRPLDIHSGDFGANIALPDRSNTLVGLPHKVLPLLQAGSHVVVVLIDGLGYDSAQAACRHGSPILSEHPIAKMSAQFPATTTAQIPSLHSIDTPVEKHGLYEWVIYEPTLGLISPLPFGWAREKNQDELLSIGVKPGDIFPSASVYRWYREHGFDSVVLSPRKIATSAPNMHMTDGADVIGYESIEDGCARLGRAIQKADSPTYFCFYIESIDALSHKFTKNSPEVDGELRRILSSLRALAVEPASRVARPCRFLITSDHGHMATPNEVRLNRLVPDLDEYLQRDRNGRVITGSGGFRTCVLHVKPERLVELKELLRRDLEEKAVVLTLEDAFEKKLFDRSLCSEKFLRRMGNLLVLSLDGYAIYHHIPEKFELPHRSVHGGASKEEMTTPLIEFDARA